VAKIKAHFSTKQKTGAKFDNMPSHEGLKTGRTNGGEDGLGVECPGECGITPENSLRRSENC